ncbi:MAG TPA: GspH/FimT family pseudopilin [Gemmatimonadales bacterium]|jgi:prepilin-type N-terminal cleavage/methylation domain-containing protein
MRYGTTLIELLLAVVILAIIAGFGIPRLSAIGDAATVNGEIQRLVTALDAARGAAIRLDGVAILSVSDTAYVVRVVSGTDTVVAWQQSGASRNGSSLRGAGAPVRFGPSGVAVGAANRTLIVAKGSAQRTVVVSRLGRLSY